MDVVEADGGVVAIGSPTQRTVLAVLASRAPTAVATDLLVDQIWGEDPPHSAVPTLRSHVSRLRRVLGHRLVSTPGGYALRPAEAVDAARFEALVARAGTRAPAEALPLVEEALALWRGPPFPGLDGVEALRGAVVHLCELHVAARELRAAGLLATGRLSEAIAAAEQLVVEAPLREGIWTTLVAALSAAGRTAEALRAYQRAVAALGEAGVEPGVRLRRAETDALSADSAGSAGRLPVALSSLIGRDTDLMHLDRLLGEARLVTLTGPGGVGKTRLAVEAAHRRAGHHEMGARFVDLVGVRSVGGLVGAVVDALGLVVDQSSPDAVVARAGQLDVLLVIDNCEHLIDDVAVVVERLLRGGERARVLATSRGRLGIEGEHVWAVAPLGLGAGQGAQALFVDRARALRPDLVLSPTDRAAVDRIVHRLDGLPLAIEMAAARTATLSLVELADRLDVALDVLRSPRRTGDPRHQTLDAVVAWSEDLLGPDERRLFEDMAVFARSATADDVAAVTGRSEPLGMLDRLVDQSLLVADTSAERVRFGMLSTVRDRAAARLGASDRVEVLHRRHAEHHRDLAQRADAELRSADEPVGHRWFDRAMDELRQAMRWSCAHDPALAADLCGALVLFAQSRMRDEPLRWAEQALAVVDDTTPGAGWVLGAVALRALRLGDLARSVTQAARAAAVARTPPEEAVVLELLGDIAFMQGDLDGAIALYRRLMDVAVGCGDPHMGTAAAVSIAMSEANAGRIDAAQAVLDRTTPPPAPSDRAWMAYAAGEVVLDRDPPRALACFDAAAALADPVENRYVGGIARVGACSLQARVGEISRAVPAFAAVITHWRRQGDQLFQLTTLRNLVVLLQRAGAAERVAELLGTVERPGLMPTYGDEARRLADAGAWAEAVLGHARADHLATRGALRTVDEAADLALAWLADLADAPQHVAG